MTPEERIAHRKKTAERILKEREEELIKDREHFEKITSGNRWKLFTGLTFFCVILALIITYDTFVDGKSVPISDNDYRFERSLYVIGSQSVWVDDNLFMVPFENMIGMDLNSFQLINSPILGDPKYIGFESNYEDSVTPLERRVHFAQKRISIYEWFPLVQILLLLPLIVFFYKRQKPWYNFAQMTCFLLIFPGSILLLFTLIF